MANFYFRWSGNENQRPTFISGTTEMKIDGQLLFGVPAKLLKAGYYCSFNFHFSIVKLEELS